MPMGKYSNFDECVRKNSDKKDPKAYCSTIMRAVEEVDVKDVFLNVSEAEFSTDETTGKMTAKVQLIKAGKALGKNRDYTPQALRRAVKEGIYNDIRMYVDHSEKPPLKRSIKELVSAVESTTYNDKTEAIDGTVEFFNKEFYDYAERARKHIGVSADHSIRVNYVQEGRQTVEKVQQIMEGRSVDWVIYPAAGGEILQFVRESEGVDDVEWGEITPELLKEKAPEIYNAILAAKESEEPDPKDDEEDEKISKVDVAKMVKEAIEAETRAQSERSSKQSAAAKATRDYLAKSGLPGKTRERIANSFADSLEFVEADVKESVEEAKAELKEAGLGPRITGMGPSGGEEGATTTIGVREAVESMFRGPKKTTTDADPKKES